MRVAEQLDASRLAGALPDDKRRLRLLDEQGDQVVGPTSSGRWLVVEDDHGASGGHRNPATRLRGGRRRPPVVLSQAHMPGWASRWGRGPLGNTQDDQETFDPGRRFAPLSPAVAVVGAGPDGALACRP
jgi:hypothetical protein